MGATELAGVEQLAASFAGELVAPGDPGYDEHRRIWNGSIDRHPQLIARCTGPDDVAAAVGLARDSEVDVAVRGGGHSFPGLSTCDGLVIDLSPIKGIEVDPDGRTARVGAGVLWGELDAATQEFGLATTGGIVTHTGVAGLTLGGGIGWLHRKHGLTIDQLLSVEIVTAAGERLRASEDENPELFWGVRGGGGNFGVVTEFEFRLHPVGPTVLAGPIFWPMSESGKLLRFYREWSADAPDELMTMVVHRLAPPLEFVPEELHGAPVVGVVSCWCGDLDQGAEVVGPLKEWGTPLIDLCEPKPYVEHQSMLDPSFPHGWWYYVRACDVAELSDEVIDITVEYAEKLDSPVAGFPIWQLGGAVARVPDEATAFNGRAAGHTFNLSGIAEGPERFDAERQWSRDFFDALEPHQTSVYVNFLMEEGQERVREAYGAEKYDRLVALKRRYDPENLFRLNQNIRPD